MRFIMLGAGGVGGYFGGRLAAAGNEITFVARGAHMEAIKNNGLSIKSPRGDLRLKDLRVVADPAAAGPADVIFLAVKLGDADAAIEAIRPVVGPGTTVISLQNGVEAEDRLEAAFGPGHVAGGVAYIAAAIETPGVIRHLGANQRIQLGTLPGHPGAPVAAIVEILAAAGIDAEMPADITLAIWQKFVFLVGLSATTTLTGQPVGVIRSDPRGRAFLHDVMAEATLVARARGVGLAADFARDRLAFADTLPEAMRASMAHDHAAGKPLELPWLSGAVVRMGAEAGVPTPVNNAVVAALTLSG